MRLKNELGLTLLEVLMVTGISTIITYSIYMAMRTGDAQFQGSDISMLIQDSAREGLYKMSQEIRQSSPTRTDILGGGNTIQFNVPNPANPVNPDYTVNWANSQRIQYARGGPNNSQIIRTNLTTFQTTVMANDVAVLTFTGNAADPTLVTLTIGVQRQMKNNRMIPPNPLQMTTQADIRNT